MQAVSLVSNLLAPITSNVQTYSCSKSLRNRQTGTGTSSKGGQWLHHAVLFSVQYSVVDRMGSNITKQICFQLRCILVSKRLLSNIQMWSEIAACGQDYSSDLVLDNRSKTSFLNASSGVNVLSLNTKHNGSTNGNRWGCRQSRLPNVLKVKSRARCVCLCVCPISVAGQIKQLSIIPLWEQDGALILLSTFSYFITLWSTLCLFSCKIRIISMWSNTAVWLFIAADVNTADATLRTTCSSTDVIIGVVKFPPCWNELISS